MMNYVLNIEVGLEEVRESMSRSRFRETSAEEPWYFRSSQAPESPTSMRDDCSPSSPVLKQRQSGGGNGIALDVAQGEETGGFNDRVMPSWTPPGVTFPIMWVLVVAPLRAFSTSLVWGGTCLDIDYEAIQSTSCAFVPCSEWSRALRPSDPHTYTASQVSPHRSALVFCSSSACLHQHR